MSIYLLTTANHSLTLGKHFTVFHLALNQTFLQQTQHLISPTFCYLYPGTPPFLIISHFFILKKIEKKKKKCDNPNLKNRNKVDLQKKIISELSFNPVPAGWCITYVHSLYLNTHSITCHFQKLTIHTNFFHLGLLLSPYFL